MSDQQSCRSEEGITVGLIDALIQIGRVLSQRDMSMHDAQEALADLIEDCDFQTILKARRIN